MTTVRSEGWRVAPSFASHGPTENLTLLLDENGLTQLGGDPTVAWQSPWSVLGSVTLVRFARGLALFATVDGVRYCWRRTSTTGFDALRSVVRAAGGTVERRRRLSAPLVTALAVTVVAASGTFAWWGAGSNNVLAQVKAVNLTAADLGPKWATVSNAFLVYFVPPAGQVFTSTTTTAPPTNSPFTRSAHLFQTCIGVSAAHDRVYGAAGQLPDYQLSSPMFRTNSFGGLEVASTAQYYATTDMVRRDVAEMARPHFGSCLANAQVAVMNALIHQGFHGANSARNWRPLITTPVFARGGEATVSVQSIGVDLTLDIVVIAHGHWEITLDVLSVDPAAVRSEVVALTQTLADRVATPGGVTPV